MSKPQQLIKNGVQIITVFSLVLSLLSLPQAPISNVRAQSSILFEDWTYHLGLTIHNNAAIPLQPGYSIRYVLDTAELISQNLMQPDCDDLRLSYGDGEAETELDRVIEACNTAATTVWFRTQAEIAPGGDGLEYHLHYGNSLADAAPAEPANVFAFYDDFQDGDAAGWTAADGNWSVVDDSGNYIYRYTGGGTGWAISYVIQPGLSDLEYSAKVRAAVNTNWIGLAFRLQDATNFLTFYQSLDISQFKYARIINDNHSILQNPGFTMTAGAWYNLRVQAIGSLVRARVWEVGTPEPDGWNISYTDTTFQTQSNLGATLYNHTTNADWDDFQARYLVANEPTISAVWEDIPWWDDTWNTRQQLTIQNQSAGSSLVTKYSVQLTLDTASLIAAGRMQNTCDDLRLVSFDGIDQIELDRLVEDCNTDHTQVWFALQRPIGVAGQDMGYYLYYGNISAGTPPADGMNIFLFYEDWEQGTTHWTNAGGLDPANTGTMGTSVITNLDSVSPVNSQQFPVKQAGGDAFSGYIPVMPSTGYAISVWGKSDANTYGPVGFDPYTSSYIKGSEVWLWTDEWTIGPSWSWRIGQFTTSSTTAYIKIKSEWWAESPGDQPVYMDNLVLRYSLAAEPMLSLGEEETTLAVPAVSDVQDNGPINLGSPIAVTAVVSTTEGTIDTVTLRLISPISIDAPMSLVSGTDADGTWEGSYLPSQGGQFSYRVLAHATTGLSTLSPLYTFDVIDDQPPQISELIFTDPLLVGETQTIIATVTDNGQVASVSLTVDGTSYPMIQNGSQYSYSWQVDTIGDISFTVVATDTGGTQAQLTGAFTSQPREVDVCTWKDCKVGAESWSNDDGSNACKDVLEAGGLRGTYYYNGTSTLAWFAEYSAAGHEIASHTVNHPCNTPCCSPNCTPETLSQCPYTEEDVTAYRQNQLEPNIAAIEAGTGQPVLSLAWPCGCTDPGRMEAASYYYLGARGYYDYIANLTWLQDVNQPTPVNLYNLNTANSYNQSFIDRAASEGTWAIVTSHGSCTGIDYMASRQDVLWAAPVGEVLEYIYIRDNTQFSNYSRIGSIISFDAAHTLNPFQRQKVDGTFFSSIPFDDPVTLQVHILEADVVESVQVDGIDLPYTIQTLQGARYVLINTPLDTSHHVVVNLGAPAPTIEQITDNSPVELGQDAQVTAVVTLPEGNLQSVVLQVLSPTAAEYPMNLVEGTTDTYTVNFPIVQLIDYNYQIVAISDEGSSAQSTVQTLQVQDTTPPAWRSMSQTYSELIPGMVNSLSVEGQDLGGLEVAILATDENGVWQEFDWPVEDWWNHGWQHRVPITLQETAGLARSAEVVDIMISSEQFSGLTSCANELRVADPDRQELPVQVYGESNEGGVLTCHLLFQASVPANDSRTFYIYYGNPLANPPSYTTDLFSSTAGGLITIQNSFFDLDIDIDGGIISRVRLPQGSNTNLPLSTEANRYWGWHQVCSSLDGNITGINSLCVGGTAPASGLSVQTTIDGPLMKEVSFTSVKGDTTYTIVYRFFAGAPYYGYQLLREGSIANVMNNFWYINGNYGLLGIGVGGTPVTTYNTYGSGNDQIRIASFESVNVASIDGTDNDGTDLGGSDYMHPTASGLDLWVTAAASQADTEAILGSLASPVDIQLGAVEDAPEGQYDSPFLLDGAVGWIAVTFAWQNPAVPVGSIVQWHVRFCDLSNNCVTTNDESFLIVAENTAPVANDDSYTTDEDTELTVPAPGVLDNDTDPDNDPLSAVLVSGPSHGALTLNSDGSFTYTPDPNFNGSDSFTYQANDGELASNVATVSITVTPVNDAPVAADDAYSTDEDTVLNVAAPGILTNDSDVDGDAVTAVLVSGPSEGTLLLNPDGSFNYTPDLNFNGSDSFTYQSNDSTLNSNVATVSITVNGINDAPLAVDDTYSTDEDMALTIDAPGVLANDSDPDSIASSYQWMDTFADAAHISSINNAIQVTDTSGEFGVSFTPYDGNPLLTLESSDPWNADGDITKMIPGAVHGDVIYFPEGMDGYKFWMIFTPAPETGSVPPGGYGSPDFWWERNTLVRSNDGINWEKTPDYTNPLVSPGAPGEWDDGWHADPDFVYAPNKGPNGESWFLYYTGCGSSGCHIALALSHDGKDYTKYGTGPVAPPYRCPTVIYDSSTEIFHMWYNWTAFDVGYATSTDGINWTPYNPVNPGQWGYIVYAAHPGTYDQGGVTHMDVIYFDGLYHMYYLALPTSAYAGLQIGHATSPDGMNWTQVAVPALVPGGETWDFWGRPSPAQVQSFYRPTVALVDDTLYMWYGGVDQYVAYPAPNYDIGLAFSTPASADGHIELDKDFQPAEYNPTSDTVAWYHMNEGPYSPEYPGEYPPVDPTLAWYHFNEGMGATTQDSGGAYYDVGVLDGATWTTGVYGDGLYFDGNDRVVVADSPDLNPQQELTIEAWVNPSVAKQNNYIAVKMTPGGADYVYGMKIDNTDGGIPRIWAFIVSSTGTLYWSKSSSTVPNNAWSHVAMTYALDPSASTSVKIFLNGVEVAYLQQDVIPANTLIKTSSGPLSIGVIPVSTPRYYEGFIDELRIVGRALTPEEIAADGTISTPTVLDSSGNDNHGTPIGGVDWTTGLFDYGLSFDGSSGYVTAPPADNMNLTDEVTIEAWVKPSLNKTNNYVVIKMTPGTNDYAYGLKLENQYTGYQELGAFIQDAAGNLYFAYGGTIAIGEWSHVAMTYRMNPSEATQIQLFINGVEVNYRYGAHNEATDTIPMSTLIRTNDGSLNIGRIPVASPHHFNGVLDELRVLGRSMSPDEILADYGEYYYSSGNLTSDLLTPPEGQVWGSFFSSDDRPAGTDVVYSVLDAYGQVLLSSINNGDDISMLGSQPIYLYAELFSSDPATTPIVNEWGVTAGSSILTAILADGPTHGLLVLNADGSFSYTPDLNFNGTDSFTYKANDGELDSNVATVSITVNPLNDPPVAVDDSATTDEDTPVTIGVLANDSDVDGDGLSVTSVSDPANGTAVINADNTVTYTPDADFNGTDSFTYTVSDGNGGTDTATVSITVNAVNDAPVAVDDSATTDEDTPVTIGVLANDSDVDEEGLSVTGVSDPANGTAVVNPDNTVTYTPDPDFNGFDSFTYTISDGNGGTDTATVSITVNPINDAPVVYVPGDQTIAEGSTFTGSGYFTDPDIDTWSATVDYGDGSGVQSLALEDDKTFDLNHLYLDDGSYTVTVCVTDGDLAETCAALMVTVTDLGPTATFTWSPEMQDEGAPVQFTDASTSYPDDIASWSWDFDGLGVSTEQSPSFTFMDNGTYNVCLTVTDDDGSMDTVCQDVTITDLAPAAGFTWSPEPQDEGAPVQFSDASSSYPDDIASWSWDFDGLGVSTEQSPSFTFMDNGTYSVCLTVTDDDGSMDTVCHNVTVLNVAPVVNAGADTTIDEGSNFTGSGSFTDPGADTWSATVDYGDGSGVQALALSEGKTFDLVQTYADNGVYTVTVCVTDDDGGSGCDSLLVTVENVAPDVSAGDDATLNEGDTFTGSGSFTDPGADTWNATVDYGDGSGVQALALSEDKTFDLSHVYADNGDYTIEVCVTDDDLAAGCDDRGVTVLNVAPVLTLSGDASVGEGSLYTLGFSSVADPGDDTISACTVDWGDGNSESCLTAIGSSLTHVYANGTNSYTIAIDLTDEDGTYADVATHAVTVENVAPLVSVTPISQTVQYSDYIDTILVTAVDVAADGLTASTIGLPANLELGAPSCTVDQEANTNTCTWIISGTVGVPEGDYAIEVSVVDDEEGQSSQTSTISILPEKARIKFHDDNPISVQVASDGGNSGEFTLSVDVLEKLPDEAPYGPAPGDIELAQVSMTLVPVGPGSPVQGSCTQTSNGEDGYDEEMLVTCSFDNVEVNTYQVVVDVSGDYYTGSNEDVLVVYDPSLGFTTGGGWFYWPGTEDPGNGYPGDKTNFGYTMKYNKKGQNVLGSLLLIRHLEEDSIYRFKSNALYGLALGIIDEGDEYYGWASFSGKGTYLEPGWPEPIGNYEFTAYVEDRNEPGTGIDRFWIEVLDKDRIIDPDLSLPRPAVSNSIEIRGGNIVVPH